jgi:hypothetical protein
LAPGKGKLGPPLIKGVVSREATVEVSPLLERDTYVSFIFSNLRSFETTIPLERRLLYYRNQRVLQNWFIKSSGTSHQVLIMSASSARGHYANPPLEDEDDLIDPDDGK